MPGDMEMQSCGEAGESGESGVKRLAIGSSLVGALVLVVGVASIVGCTSLRFRELPAHIRRMIDWEAQNKLPPWMTSIEEGSPQGVAIVLGQSLKPDGTPSQVLIDRARMAKTLLDEGKVVKVIVSGGDPAGVGHTEASELAKVLMGVGIPAESIILEAQATTTAENIWFSLRWLPKATGQLYIITSDFHMARATYISREVLGYWYKMLEDTYKNNPDWHSATKLYPRLTLHQVPVASFCGSNASLNHDDDPKADVTTKSLALRAMDELKWLGSREVPNALFGSPMSNILYIWPIQINVTKDANNPSNFEAAMAVATRVAQGLCACTAPPEGVGPEIPYPLTFPLDASLPTKRAAWREVIKQCRHR